MKRREFIKLSIAAPALTIPHVPPSETETEKLARWWNMLNHWKWPDDMPGKPKDWDNLPYFRLNGQSPSTRNKHDTSKDQMIGIAKIIGGKECLRWHWLNNLNKTNAEFEAWFDQS